MHHLLLQGGDLLADVLNGSGVEAEQLAKERDLVEFSGEIEGGGDRVEGRVRGPLIHRGLAGVVPALIPRGYASLCGAARAL